MWYKGDNSHTSVVFAVTSVGLCNLKQPNKVTRDVVGGGLFGRGQNKINFKQYCS